MQGAERRCTRAALGWATALAVLSCDAADDAFVERAAPALERHCAAATCHGAREDAEARGEHLDWSRLLFRVDQSGHLLDLPAARAAALRAATTREDRSHSTLLRKNLRASAGGLPHAGGPIFGDLDHAGARALLAWLAAEAPEAGAEGSAPLAPLAAQFAAEVQPILLERGCALGNCHGSGSPVPFRLDPGGPAGPGRLASAQNYAEARRFLALDGDPRASRLLRKTLRVTEGGQPHRAGVSGLIGAADGAEVAAVAAWACAERAALVEGSGCEPAEAAAPAQIALELGPPASAPLFALDVYTPGTRVVVADSTADGSYALPTTAPALDRFAGACAADALAACDVRDPAVDAAATRLVAAVRPSAAAGRALWLVALDGGPPMPLTAALPCPGAARCHDRDPAFGPGGRLYFVSDRGVGLADDGAVGSELFELDVGDGALRRRTFSPHRVRWPAPFRVGGETAGTVGVTLLRAAIPGARKAHPFRLAPDLHTELHQHFGVTFPFAAMVATVELADGRYAATALPIEATEALGDLLVVDRNLGPALPPAVAASEAALPAYVQPYALIAASALGAVAVGDVAALAGTEVLLAARRPDGRAGLLQLRLGARHDAVAAAEAARWLLLAPEGAVLRNPRPLLRRAPAPGWAVEYADPADTHGLLVHQGVPMIDQLLGALPPHGPRLPRDDLVSVRLLEPVRLAAATRAQATLGALTPVRVLAELPLAADGSFQAEIPARVPYRVQAIAADGMAAGTPHNRWLHHEPGQRVPQGVAARAGGPYARTCAVCHGAADGDPDHALPGGVDLMSSASWTLSRYEGGDPRRPLAPTRVGEADRVEVDFRRDVEPILAARCATAGCHLGAAAAGGLELGDEPAGPFTRAYVNLLAKGAGSGGGYRYVDAAGGGARASALAERLLGVELDAPAGLPQPAAPHGGLNADERATVLRWIDLGASFVGAATAAEASP